MASIGSVVVQFLADDKMSKTVGNITRGLKDLNKKTDDSDGKMGKLSGTLKAGVAAGAVAAGAAVVGLGKFMIDAGKAALEDKAAADKLAGTLSSLKGVTEETIAANAAWIDAMELATSVSDDELRQAMSRLALATGDVEEAQKLVTLAVDTAAGSGKSLTSVTEALAKAADGNTAALKRQFPWLDANEDGTVTLKEAVEGLGKAYGGTAEEAANTDPWKRLQTIWGQLTEALGEWLLPLIEDFGKWFSNKKNQKAIQEIIEKVRELSGELGDELVDAIKDFLKWIGSEEGKADMKAFAQTANDVARAIAAIASAIVWLIKQWDRVPQWMKTGGGLGAWTGPIFAPKSAAPQSTGPSTMASGPTAAAPPIFVTEDMVAQAISRMVVRSDGRRGRMVLVS